MGQAISEGDVAKCGTKKTVTGRDLPRGRGSLRPSAASKGIDTDLVKLAKRSVSLYNINELRHKCPVIFVRARARAHAYVLIILLKRYIFGSSRNIYNCVIHI